MYAPLHVHTEHSALDGLARLGKLAAAAKDRGIKAMAITDHGSPAGVWDWAKACAQEGITPIPGIEAYMAIGSRFEKNVVEELSDEGMSDADDSGTGETRSKNYHHLTLLAYNRAGWHNLIRLHNESQKSVWFKPRMDLELIAEHSEGLIATTGCLASPVNSALKQIDLVPLDNEEKDHIAQAWKDAETACLSELFHGTLERFFAQLIINFDEMPEDGDSRRKAFEELAQLCVEESQDPTGGIAANSHEAEEDHAWLVEALIECGTRGWVTLTQLQNDPDDSEVHDRLWSEELTYQRNRLPCNEAALENLEAAVEDKLLDTVDLDDTETSLWLRVDAAIAKITAEVDVAGSEHDDSEVHQYLTAYGLAAVRSVLAVEERQDELYAEAAGELEKLIDAVGAENVYIELMNHGIAAEAAVTGYLRDLADEYGLTCVVTGDSHYIEADDAQAHEAFLAVGTGSTFADQKRFKFHGGGYHLKTYEQMCQGWEPVVEYLGIVDEEETAEWQQWWHQAVDNTMVIADRVTADVVPEPKMRLPRFPVEEMEADNASDELRLRVERGAESDSRYGESWQEDQELVERIDHELKVITDMGFADYFLITQDVVDWCRTTNSPICTEDHPRGEPGGKTPIVPGAGRGCLTGDARIWTTGGYKRIADVRISDTVRTHTGRLQKVTNTFVYDVAEPLVEIRSFYDGQGVTMTGDHKVLVVRAEAEDDPRKVADGYKFKPSVTNTPEWVQAQDVNPGDLVCIPRPSSTGTAPETIDVAPLLPRAPKSVEYEVTDDEIIERVGINKSYPNSLHEVSLKTGVTRNVIQSLLSRGVCEDGPIYDIASNGRSKTGGATVHRRAPRSEAARDILWDHLRKEGFSSLREWDKYIGEMCVVEVRTPRYVRVDDDLLFLIGAWASLCVRVNEPVPGFFTQPAGG
ncbi:MAG: PHP domain-containing protein [Nesterenkonia sp.]